MPGIVNGRFHLFTNGEQYNLLSNYNELNNDTSHINLPLQFRLNQNYPNPFNPITTLHYDLPVSRLVNITIYDIKGRIVKTLVNSLQTAGYKAVQLRCYQ